MKSASAVVLHRYYHKPKKDVIDSQQVVVLTNKKAGMLSQFNAQSDHVSSYKDLDEWSDLGEFSTNLPG